MSSREEELVVRLPAAAIKGPGVMLNQVYQTLDAAL